MNLWANTGGAAATTRLGRGSSRRRKGLLRAILAIAQLALIGSLLMTGAVPVVAVHDEGIFELDGNALDQGGVDGDDWENGTPGAADDLFIPGEDERRPGVDVDVLQGRRVEGPPRPR